MNYCISEAKKPFLLLLFFTTFVYTHAQQLRKGEYFYDADPGVGNATQFILFNTANTDSTFTFSVGALSNGLHVIYVRVQDTAGNWGLAYTSSFIKQPGNDSIFNITKMEYFLDVDPGFGNGTAIPITPSTNINDTFSFNIPDNGANTRTLYVRALDSRGSWSLLYNSIINLCQLYKASANFGWVRFANSYSFVDSSQNNPSHSLRWYFDTVAVDSVTNPVYTFPQGHYYVTLVAGSQGCRSDTLTLPLYSGLEEYYPNVASNGGDVIMNFYGGGLDTNTVITLINGSTNIQPYQKQAFELKEFDGIFDLHAAPAGRYDISIHYSNGFDTTIVGGLQVAQLSVDQNNYDPEIEMSVFGAHVARGNTTVQHHLVITNSGSVVAKSVPIWIAADNHINYTPSPAYTYSTPDSLVDYQDSVPVDQAIDSIYGQPYQGKLHNFIIPELNTGQSFTYNYSVTAPPNEGETYYLYYWNNPAMFGSPIKRWVGGCLDNVFDFALGFVPVVSSVNAGYNYFSSDLPDFYHGKTSVGSFAFSTFSTVASIIPGANFITKLDKSKKIIQSITLSDYATNIFFAHASAVKGLSENCADTSVFGNGKTPVTDQISADPNGISGPVGYGSNNYINGKGKLGYEVYFENKPTATANAQRVYIADTLDKTKFDLSTFELTGFSVADSFFTIPIQRKEYFATVDLRPKKNLLLRYNAKLDTATGILSCTFLSLDPVTGDTLQLSDTTGFLPPDVDNISGTGSIAYVVKYKTGLSTNDVVTDGASIIFDNNEPILTNTWLNTLDKTAPTGAVSGSTFVDDTTALLNLNGTDVGAGIAKYRIFASENNGPYIDLGYIDKDTLRFSGDLDSTYSFFAIPSDSVNNSTPKGSPDYSITFTSRITPLLITNFSGQYLNGENHLTTSVTNALNVKTIELQKSINGVNFSFLSNIAVAPITSGTYNYNDRNPVSRKNYYRLRIIDIDGKASYSNVVVLNNTSQTFITIYPNPATTELNIIFKNVTTGKYVFILTDIVGRILQSKDAYLMDGNETEILSLSGYTHGTYVLSVTDPFGKKVVNKKILKE